MIKWQQIVAMASKHELVQSKKQKAKKYETAFEEETLKAPPVEPRP
jgi:hypothetical protein